MRALTSSGSLPRGPVAAAVVAAVVLVASLLPVPIGTGAESSGVLGVDLLFHAVGYAALAAVTLDALDRAHPDATARSAALAFAAAVAFGLFVELLQGTLQWRTLAVADAVANAVGAALGILVLAVLRIATAG